MQGRYFFSTTPITSEISEGWLYDGVTPPRYGVFSEGGVFSERLPDGYRVAWDEKTKIARLERVE